MSAANQLLAKYGLDKKKGAEIKPRLPSLSSSSTSASASASTSTTSGVSGGSSVNDAKQQAGKRTKDVEALLRASDEVLSKYGVGKTGANMKGGGGGGEGGGGRALLHSSTSSRYDDEEEVHYLPSSPSSRHPLSTSTPASPSSPGYYLKPTKRGNKVDSLFKDVRASQFDLYVRGNKNLAKVSTLAQYKFYFAFENTFENCDYVSEKVYAGWAAGSVPLYMGSPHIEEYAPGDNSVIDVRKGLEGAIKPLREVLVEKCGEKGLPSIMPADTPKVLLDELPPLRDMSEDVWACVRKARGANYLLNKVAATLVRPLDDDEQAQLDEKDKEVVSEVGEWKPHPILAKDFALSPLDAASLLLFLREQPDLYHVYLQWKEDAMGGGGKEGTVGGLRPAFVYQQDYLCPYLTEERPLWQCRVCTAAVLAQSNEAST